MQVMLGCLLLCAVLAAGSASVTTSLYGSVFFNNGQPQVRARGAESHGRSCVLTGLLFYQFVSGAADASAAAFGSYDPAENHISNFAVLKVQTNSSYSDLQQMYAAGYLEAAFTTQGMH